MEDTRTLIDQWETHSAGQIAATLKRTRSAVCGKAGRLRRAGVSLAPMNGKQYAVPPPNAKKLEPVKRKRERTVPVKPALPPQGARRPLPQTDQLAVDPCTIGELDSLRCHWPLGPINEVAQLFCGGPVYLPTPYCLHHLKRAYAHPENAEGRTA
jgi:hypothetical protein